MFNSDFDNHASATDTSLSRADSFAGSKLVSTTNSFPEVLEHATLRRPLAPKFLMLHNGDWRKNLLQSDLEWQFKQLKKSKDCIHLNCYKGWVDGECRMELLNDLCCYNLRENARAFSHDYAERDKLASDRIQAVFGRLDDHPEPICIVRVRRDDNAEDLYYVPDFFFYRAVCRDESDDIFETEDSRFNITYIGAANIYFHSLTIDEKAAPAVDWYYNTMTCIMMDNVSATSGGVGDER